MKNLWNDGEAEKLVADYAKKGVGRDLALTRSIRRGFSGGDPAPCAAWRRQHFRQDEGHRHRRR